MRVLMFNPHYTFNSSVSGQVTLAHCMHRALRSHFGDDLLVATFNGVGRECKYAVPDVDHYLNYRKAPQGLAVLKSFDPDVIIMGQGGFYAEIKNQERYSLWYQWISDLGKPYFICIHNEDDVLFYPAVRIGLDDPLCRGFIYASPHMARLFGNYVDRHDEKVAGTVYQGFVIPGTPDFKAKEDLIVSTGRPSSRIGVDILVDNAPLFQSFGMIVKTYGSGILPRFVVSWKEVGESTDPPCWTYEGNYLHTELSRVLNPAKFHWDCLQQRKKRPRGNRVDNTTIEGAAHGCVPIICREMMPEEFVHGENCIALSRTDIDAGVGDVICLLSDDKERRRIAFNAYKTVKNGHDYMKHLPRVLNFVEKMV